jgi:hypothetical protein
MLALASSSLLLSFLGSSLLYSSRLGILGILLLSSANRIFQGLPTNRIIIVI